MRKFTLVIALFFSLIGKASSGDDALSIRSVSGLWEYPGKWVWVQLNDDGSAFQCRVAKGGKIFRSKGIFISPSSIAWQKVKWGTDKISLEGDAMVLHGKWGNFRYVRSSGPIAPECSSGQGT